MTPRRDAPLLDHRLTPAQLTERLETAIAACDEQLAKVVARPDAERTFTDTVEAIEQALATFTDAAYRLQILKDLHPDPAVREAAAGVEERAAQYGVQVSARRDLYRAVKAYVDGRGRTDTLEPEQSRLLELMLREYRRNGLELSDEDLAKLVALRTRMATLSTEFQRHLNENQDRIEVSADELAGLPPSFVERLEPAPNGGRWVTTKYPDYFPFMENAESGAARRRLAVAFNAREADRNLPILKEVVRLRDEAARLLGYPTHADYVTEDRMAKSAARVQAFLDSLRTKLTSRRDGDYAKLTELKREHLGDPSARLEPWDAAFYLNRLKKRDYTLDTETIREFFPSDTVLKGMFDVYEALLSVELREVPGADTWHDSVKLYEIRDRPGGALLAYFYADLVPRPGKYGHAAVAPLNVPRAEGGGYVAPVAVLIANFAPPSKDRPSLLSHEEVRTLFHEFGHVMHQTLTVARYGSLSGFNVAGDFVEAPSQMLENWVFEPEVLDRLSGHWQDPSRKLPRETIDRMRAARMFDAGYRYTRQVFLATFDQALHTSGPDVDPDELDRRLYRQVLAMEPIPGTHFAATFGHLLGGYDAGYYGYLWSEVFAADMYTRFEKEGVLSSTLGRLYRDTILALGRSIEPDVLLERFLGRPASDEAFLGKLGVTE